MTSFRRPAPDTATSVRDDSLITVFHRELKSLGISGEEERLLVACSGGVDSLVLLHLMRFGAGLRPVQLHAAHFDHGMRPESEKDAHWVRGVCRAWEIPLVEGRVDSAPTSEAEARERRYEFLFRARETAGANWRRSFFGSYGGRDLPALGGSRRAATPGFYGRSSPSPAGSWRSTRTLEDSGPGRIRPTRI